MADEIRSYWHSPPFSFFFFLKKKRGDERDKQEEGTEKENREETHCWAQKNGVSSGVAKHCTFFKSPLQPPPQETDSRGVGQGEESVVGRSRVIVRYVSSAPPPPTPNKQRLTGDVKKNIYKN